MTHSTPKIKFESKASKALSKWAELLEADKRNLIMIPHRLASLVKCHPRTIYREIDKWVANGDVVIHNAGSRAKRHAIELRLVRVSYKMSDLKKKK